MTEHLHASCASADESRRCLDGTNGRNRAPKTAQFNTTPESTINVPRHPYSRINNSISGAKMNVPSPDPATAIPFFFSMNKKMDNQISPSTF